MSTWWRILSRRKRVEPLGITTDTQLARVLSTFDLTALGVGSTLGVGVYVLAGHVAKEVAGPSVIISFLIAAVASVFAGLCYAEFGARVPRAGSAYIYSYICVGEFIAFIIGWNLILEYVIGSASVARGLSLYLDTLLNNTLKDTFRDIAPIDSSFMSQYFDFFSFGITMLLGVALAFGLKESSLMNNIFTIINIGVVLFVIIAGSSKADPKNWDLPANITGGAGKGGFFPFGISGTIKGAATCFYGFVGFDCIATTGEEVRNPKRAIPIAIIVSLLIIFLSYFGTSAVITLMWPYYDQDPNAPIPHVFQMIGWNWAKWIVSIGGIFGLCASLFGAMFPLPRIIYAMASDALVFKFLGSISDRFRTPVIGTILAALLTGVMSALFDLKQLVNMMSIGTLMAYTIVAACVIILRFSIDEEEIAEWRYSLLQPEMASDDEYSTDGQQYIFNDDEDLQLTTPRKDMTFGSFTKHIFNFSKSKPTYLTQKLVTIQVFIFTLLALILATLIAYLQSDLETGDLLAVIATAIVVGLMLLILFSIWAQPTSSATLAFKVPLVPLIPALSICVNLYLMMMLDGNTWIRFGVWMTIGLPIYFISCKLYKMVDKKPTHQNGHINHDCTNSNDSLEQNGKTLTIPKIMVDPPSIAETVWEDPTTLEPETRNPKLIVERKPSVDLNQEETNVLKVLDKVLDEQNNTDFSEQDHTNQDKMSICSSNSESGGSEEHQIEAIVHQEDSTEVTENTILTNLNDDELSDNFGSARSSIILTDTQLGEESSDDFPKKESNESTNEENIEVNKPSSILDQLELNYELVKSNTESKHPEKLDASLQSKEPNNEPAVFIPPPPPPLLGLLDIMSIDHLPLPRPVRKYKATQPSPFITESSINNVVLRQTPKPRKRTESTTSNDSTSNVKLDSKRYQNFKSKLNNIFKNKPVINLAPRKSIPDDRTPSPLAARELDLFVFDQYEEEIPEDFAKTKKFKETLNNLLMRKHSSNSVRSSIAEKYQKNYKNGAKMDETELQKQLEEVNNVTEKKQDEVKIDIQEEMKEKDNKDADNYEYDVMKRMENMRQTLSTVFTIRPINKSKEKKLDNTEKKIHTEQYDVKDENKEAKKFKFEKHDQSVRNTKEKDINEHKKKMLGTLRSIKLRRTGIPLNDEDIDEQNNQSNEIEKQVNLEENKQTTSKEEHKGKMLGTLRSIKLRKTGIPLNDDDNNSDEQNERETGDDTENESEGSDKHKDIEEHRKSMMGTLRSIKLRKTGISLSEDDHTVL